MRMIWSKKVVKIRQWKWVVNFGGAFKYDVVNQTRVCQQRHAYVWLMVKIWLWSLEEIRK